MNIYDFVNECIRIGLNKNKDRLSVSEYTVDFEQVQVHTKYGVYILSLQDLFSRGRGLMEFVKRKVNDERNTITRHTFDKLSLGSYKEDMVEYQYMNMSLMNENDKVEYFLKNAIIS